MDGQCLFPNTVHVLPQKFDGLNFDGLAGKRQKHQNFPRQNSGYVALQFSSCVL